MKWEEKKSVHATFINKQKKLYFALLQREMQTVGDCEGK